jgi:hypothetical protein
MPIDKSNQSTLLILNINVIWGVVGSNYNIKNGIVFLLCINPFVDLTKFLNCVIIII